MNIKSTPDLNFEILENRSLFEIDKSNSPFHDVVSFSNKFENGAWRTNSFITFLMNNLSQTALSFEERQKAVNDSFSALSSASKRLRISDDQGKGSEIAEILLYGIMSRYVGALPIVPKIFYKQNDQDNAKGADSVHILLEEDGRYTLWFGEAKFYNSISKNRLDDPVKSVLNSLEEKALRKETSIITNLKDLDSAITDLSILNQIKISLSPSTPLDEIKGILHIPILFLYESNLVKQEQTLSDALKQNLIEKHRSYAMDYFSKLVSKQNQHPIFLFEKINFHLIIFPVPDKSDIVKRFYKIIDAVDI